MIPQPKTEINVPEVTVLRQQIAKLVQQNEALFNCWQREQSERTALQLELCRLKQALSNKSALLPPMEDI
jgi:regulator of replication initiation timing